MSTKDILMNVAIISGLYGVSVSNKYYYNEIKSDLKEVKDIIGNTTKTQDAFYNDRSHNSKNHTGNYNN